MEAHACGAAGRGDDGGGRVCGESKGERGGEGLLVAELSFLSSSPRLPAPHPTRLPPRVGPSPVRPRRRAAGRRPAPSPSLPRPAPPNAGRRRSTPRGRRALRGRGPSSPGWVPGLSPSRRRARSRPACGREGGARHGPPPGGARAPSGLGGGGSSGPSRSGGAGPLLLFFAARQKKNNRHGSRSGGRTAPREPHGGARRAGFPTPGVPGCRFQGLPPARARGRGDRRRVGRGGGGGDVLRPVAVVGPLSVRSPLRGHSVGRSAPCPSRTGGDTGRAAAVLSGAAPGY